ncbi:MAG: NAD-dependent epimerase/dehydratase family protein [Cellvibrionaceae bacterium]
MMSEKILLLGFGDIAQRLSKAFALDSSLNYAITGIRRSQVTSDYADMIQADLCDQSAMNKVLANQFDVIVMTMTPSEMSDEGYRQAYVETSATLLASLSKQSHQPRLIIFVSSTGVYGQKNAEWVDEESVTEPSSYSGKRLLEAEQLFTEYFLTSRVPCCIVRFSGIYGPGRQRLIEQVEDGHGAAKEPILYSNRIHADDCAGVLKHLIETQKTSAIESHYLASDCEPSPLYDVKQWLAEQLLLPKDHLQPKPLGRTLRSSKRCSNRRLLASGYEFTYPTFKEGYRSVLEQYQANKNDQRLDTSKPKILVVYDKQCPACHFYCNIIRIRESVGELVLVDARENSEVMEEITEKGLDIDQGMVVKVDDQLYYGSEAIHILTSMGSESSWLNRFNYWLFRSKARAEFLYPKLRFIRNCLLKLLGKSKINNLDLDNNHKF